MAGAKTVGNAQLTVKERCFAAAGAALVAAVIVNPLDVVKVLIFDSRIACRLDACCVVKLKLSAALVSWQCTSTMPLWSVL